MNVTKYFLCVSAVIFMQLTSYAQELEVNGSFNTSNEQRLEKAKGIGLQYEQNIKPKYIMGIGIHYNYNKTDFYTLTMMGSHDLEKISSNAKRISLRLNIQRLLKDNEYVSLSIGPEISYNYLWSHDNKFNWIYADSSYSIHTTQNINAKNFGVGLISKIEIKDFIKPQLSLCFTIRPEMLIGNPRTSIGQQTPALSGFSCTEFQIGLKYNFKNM